MTARVGILRRIGWALVILLAVLGYRTGARAGELVLQVGHAGSVPCLAFSRDGSLLASGSTDNTVRVWDTRTWDLLRVFERYSGATCGLSFCGRGATLAFLGGRRGLELVDARSGERLPFPAVRRPHDLVSLAASRDGRTLALCYRDGLVRLWDPEGRRIRQEFRPFDESPDARPAEPGAEPPPRSPGTALALSVDGGRLLMSLSDGSVCLFETRAGRRLQHWMTGNERTRAVEFSPDDRLAAAGDEVGRIFLWDTRSGKPAGVLPSKAPIGNALGELLEGLLGMPAPHPISGRYLGALAFGPDGKRLAAGNGDDATYLWDLATRKSAWRSRGARVRVAAVAVSPDGRRIASAEEEDLENGAADIRILDSRTGRVLRTLLGHSTWLHTQVLSPDGRLLALLEPGPTLVVWDLQRGALLTCIRLRADWVEQPVFSADGRRMAAIVDEGIRAWELPLRSPGRARPFVSTRAIRALDLAFGPDGTTLVAACGVQQRADEIQTWSRSGRRSRIRLAGELVHFPVLSPGGRWLAAIDQEGQLATWDARTGALRSAVRPKGGSGWLPPGRGSMELSPDGRTLAIWSGREGYSLDNSIPVASGAGYRLLDPLTGDWKPGFREQKPIIDAMGFSADHERVWTLQQLRDRSVRIAIWRIATGELLDAQDFTVGESDSLEGDLAYSPATNRLVRARPDGSVDVWDLAANRKLGTLHYFPRRSSVRAPEAWLAVTPDGDSSGSGSAGYYVRWRNGNVTERRRIDPNKPFGRPDVLEEAFKPFVKGPKGP